MDGIKIRIINNLKVRCHPVNDQTALSGVDDLQDGLAALRELTEDGTVETEQVNIAMPNETPAMRTLYILGYDARVKASEGLRRIK